MTHYHAIEIRIKTQNDSYKWFVARAQAQFDSTGQAIRVCGSMSSIQALKTTQAKLENSNSDLENFASMAAHEIKSPIRSISSYLELIRYSQEELPEKTHEYIGKSIEIANETGKMIDELLEYASLQEATLNLNEMNTEKMVKLLIRNMKEDIKMTGAEITFDDISNVICDETKIKTVITNLLQNALKYGATQGPEISIETSQDNYFWQFSIKDNGRGMSEKDVKKAFTMFERADNTGGVKGTGIGLAICQRIIDLHQGEIWVESELDKGSTFHFTISKHLSPDTDTAHV